jgi:hypothetical protein
VFMEADYRSETAAFYVRNYRLCFTFEQVNFASQKKHILARARRKRHNPVSAGHRIANRCRICDAERTHADGSSANTVIESLKFEGRRNPVGRLTHGMILVLPPI